MWRYTTALAAAVPANDLDPAASNQAVSTGQTVTFAGGPACRNTPSELHSGRKTMANIAGATLSTYHDSGDGGIGHGATFDGGRSPTSGQRDQRLGNFDREWLLSDHYHSAGGQPIRDHPVKLRHLVTATSVTPARSQWQRNGANIASATSPVTRHPQPTILDGGGKIHRRGDRRIR